MSIQISSLPDPDIIEDVTSVENLKAQRIEDFKELAPEYEIYQDGDIVTKNVNINAVAENRFITKLNDAVKAVLIATSTGNDLDNVAANYNIARSIVTPADPDAIPPTEAVFETDDAFRNRILLTQAGIRAESDSYFSSVALDVERVADVFVQSTTAAVIDVYILATDNGGVADSALLTAVSDAFSAEIVKIGGVQVNVNSASIVTQDLYIDVFSLPDTPVATFESLEGIFNTAFASEIGLARDLNLAWINKTLLIDGISDIKVYTDVGKTILFSDLVATESQKINIGTLSLTNAGFKF